MLAIAFFVLIWWILAEGDEDLPWMPAGIGAGFILLGAVYLREYKLKKARQRYLLAEKRLDHNLRNISVISPASQPSQDKLTLEKNAALLDEINRKSEAAKILGKLPEAHLEVFEYCSRYLQRSETELKTVGLGSPRIPAIRQGRNSVKKLHKFHLLAWAEIESRALTQEAKNRATISDKVEAAQKALTVLETALEFYPTEAALIESAEVVKELIGSMKISDIIEQAEKAAFKGNNKKAIGLYRDALFYLARDSVRTAQRQEIADQVNKEIEKLRSRSLKTIKTEKAVKKND